MPKKKEPVNASRDLAWLKKLPDEGGAWAKGLMASVESVESEVARLRDQKTVKDREAAALGDKIGAREKILAGYVRRAATEARSLYTTEAVADALTASQAQNSASSPAKDKPARQSTATAE